MGTVRPAAVAGTFYPADPRVLRRTVTDLLAHDPTLSVDVIPRMVIVPHAGYVYSGPVAACAYRLLSTSAAEAALLVGPSHFVAFTGMATPGVDALATPLGEMPTDSALVARAEGHPLVAPRPIAHNREHSLEVQLPFLQTILPGVTVVPLLTGDVAPESVGMVLAYLLDRPGVVGVISSDLSHYLPYEQARRKDAATVASIRELRPEDLSWDDACGLTGIQAALLVACDRGWSCRLLDHRNSGDTAGTRDSVVGYAAFAIGPLIG
ncbi:MAG: AmmeMemoRadiSam system protein B [Actinobacteria bacterium RBG_16_67_15]|nr:MAG: AmmeMemoRadiSam system protein B [Actinobacteria bacterium RBG_16_67_15]